MHHPLARSRVDGRLARSQHGRARRDRPRPARQRADGEHRRAAVIIVGYDGTPQARAALAFAAGRADLHGKIVVVHVVAPAHGYLGQPHYDRAVTRAQRDGLAVLDDLPTRASAVDTVLLEGKPAAVLARVAHVRNASQIVIGSRRRGPLLGWLGGSLSRRLIALADRPVVLVPAPPAS